MDLDKVGVQVSLVIKVKNQNPKAAEMMRAFGDDWTNGTQAAHDTWVMRVLEYIVRFSRVDTGRSRAGWFRFMDSKGYNYQRSLPPTGVEDASDEGRAMGGAISEPFLTTIINNVVYVDPMNQRYGLFNFGPQRKIYTVSELSQEIKGLFEKQFPDVWVTGEVSNFRPADEPPTDF